MKADYSSATTPVGYVCSQCGVSGVKLWREYNKVGPKALCAQHAAARESEDIATMGPDGRRSDEHDFMTDQIGGLVPAIPDEEGDGYWGYTSVPQAGVEWWQALPNEKKESE